MLEKPYLNFLSALKEPEDQVLRPQPSQIISRRNPRPELSNEVRHWNFKAYNRLGHDPLYFRWHLELTALVDRSTKSLKR